MLTVNDVLLNHDAAHAGAGITSRMIFMAASGFGVAIGANLINTHFSYALE